MQLSLKYRTISDLLMEREDCTRQGARFLSRTGEPTFYPYRDVVGGAKRVAGTLQAARLQPGDRVAIILPTSIEHLQVFLGVQLSGGIPAALYPPLRLGRLEEYFARTRRMMGKIGAGFLVTDKSLKKLIGAAVEGTSLTRVFDPEELSGSARWTPVETEPESPAFLQFSSGTTVEPKAVRISHSNLLHNLEMMDSLFSFLSPEEAEQGCVCWLPLYHDMGLVGCLFMGLYHPGTVTYIRPELFIARPALWLQTMSRYRAVVSAAPDFAYGLCLSRVPDGEMEGLDLSHWRLALNGAEPIDTEVMQRFCNRFSRWGFRPEAMTPVYGLAEASLAVTFSDPQLPPIVREFDRQRLSAEGRAVPGPGRRMASVGRPLPGLEVRIRDEKDIELEEGRVGRIVVRGNSITGGYYNDPDLSRAIMRNGWLDTGDLGFFLGGELYVSGRRKDLVIVRGRNYAPQEIEELLKGIDGLRKGCVVAVGQMVEGGGERLVLLAERDRRCHRDEEEIKAEMKARVIAGISLVPEHIELLQPGTLPRTSSGKMRRGEALRMFQLRRLDPPKRLSILGLLRELGRSQLAWGRFWFRRRLRGVN